MTHISIIITIFLVLGIFFQTFAQDLAFQANAFYYLGTKLQKTVEFQESIRKLKKSTELNPKNAWAFNNLGAVYSGMSLFDKAVANLKQAILLKPYIEECDDTLFELEHDDVYLACGEVPYPQNEATGKRSIPRNTCIIDGVEQRDCTGVAANPELFEQEKEWWEKSKIIQYQFDDMSAQAHHAYYLKDIDPDDFEDADSSSVSECDKIIAKIFGDANSFAGATGNEARKGKPSLRSTPKDLADIKSGKVRENLPRSWPHINGYAIHLFSKSDDKYYGKVKGNIYVPDGFIRKEKFTDDGYYFFYPKLGNQTNATLLVMHVDANQVARNLAKNKRNKNGSLLIGTMTDGGGSLADGYLHSHMELHKGDRVPNASSKKFPDYYDRQRENQKLRNKTRIFFPDVFCPWYSQQNVSQEQKSL